MLRLSLEKQKMTRWKAVCIWYRRFWSEFMDEDLDRLVDALASQGIRYVTDTLAADVSMTDSVLLRVPAGCWDDTLASPAYLSLSLNRGCVDAIGLSCSRDSLPQSCLHAGFDYYQAHNHGVSRNPRQEAENHLQLAQQWQYHYRFGNAAIPILRSWMHILPKTSFPYFVSRLRSKGIEARTCTYADCPVTADSIVTPAPSGRPPGSVGRALKKKW